MNKTTNENKKSYKKPLVLGAIAVLLTLIGVTGGNTYAKYVTSKSTQSTTATVAKWGYVIEADAANLFASKYGEDPAESKVMVAKTEGAGIVASGAADDAKVVAPGSKGSTTIKVTGKAEVAAQLTVDVSYVNNVFYGTYKPVNWTLTGAGKTWTYDKTGAKFVWNDGVTNRNTIDIAANTDLTGEHAMVFTLTWEWAFETGENADDKAMNNAYDTILGYKVAYEAETDTTMKDAIKKAAEAVSYTKADNSVTNAYDAKKFGDAKTSLSAKMAATIEQVAK